MAFLISTTPSFNERLSASPSSAVLKRLILSLLKSYTDVGATFERISVAVKHIP
jgi:hypothetical protein